MLTLSPGNYYLLLSGSGRYPLDSAGALIFPNFTDGTTDASKQQAATSALPIASYTGNTDEGGGYLITITSITAVPEPGVSVALLAGAACLALTGKLRRRSAL